MANEPDSISEPTPKKSAGMSRRGVLKNAAGAGIIMSSFTSGSALASVGCKQFSRWASGGSMARDDDGLQCTLGRSPGYWKQPQHFAEWVGVVPPTCSDNCNGQGDPVLNHQGATAFGSVFPDFLGEADVTFWHVLADQNGYGIARPFAAAYLNANAIAGYPLLPEDVTALWETYRNNPELAGEIEQYLLGTYED